MLRFVRSLDSFPTLMFTGLLIYEYKIELQSMNPTASPQVAQNVSDIDHMCIFLLERERLLRKVLFTQSIAP